MSDRIWITWEVQRRNKSMSKMLDATLYELTLNAPAWRRYPVLITKTILLIWRLKPKIIFSQNPSLVLSGLAVLISKIIKTPVIIDAHNAGLYPLEKRYPFLTRIAAMINGAATGVIVTNDPLKQYVEVNGGKAVVIPDPIPVIACEHESTLPEDTFNIVFVCSWSDDEPYLEVIEAAKEIDESVRIYITGKSQRVSHIIPTELPNNIVLTGFLSNADYENLICTSHAIMVLTTREDCLVCGAYEATSIEKPLILSNTECLKNYFNKGSIYTDNTATGIRNAIANVVREYATLEREVKDMKNEKIAHFKKFISDFEKDTLNNLG